MRAGDSDKPCASLGCLLLLGSVLWGSRAVLAPRDRTRPQQPLLQCLIPLKRLPALLIDPLSTQTKRAQNGAHGDSLSSWQPAWPAAAQCYSAGMGAGVRNQGGVWVMRGSGRSWLSSGLRRKCLVQCPGSMCCCSQGMAGVRSSGSVPCVASRPRPLSAVCGEPECLMDSNSWGVSFALQDFPYLSEWQRLRVLPCDTPSRPTLSG